MLTYSEQSDRDREAIEVEDELAGEALEARAKETFDYEWGNETTMIPLKLVKQCINPQDMKIALSLLKRQMQESEIARIIREGDFL